MTIHSMVSFSQNVFVVKIGSIAHTQKGTVPAQHPRLMVPHLCDNQGKPKGIKVSKAESSNEEYLHGTRFPGPPALSPSEKGSLLDRHCKLENGGLSSL